jgi:hypothetical protein
MKYDKETLSMSRFLAEGTYKCGSAWDGDRDYTADLANAKESFPRLIERAFRDRYTGYAAMGYYPEENNWPKGLPKTEAVKGYDRKYLERVKKELTG